MTHDVDPGQHTRLALWLGVSLLLHAVAVPFLKSATTADGGPGQGLRVTLTGAVPANPRATASSAGSAARAEDDPARERSGERRREPRVDTSARTAAADRNAPTPPLARPGPAPVDVGALTDPPHPAPGPAPQVIPEPPLATALARPVERDEPGPAAPGGSAGDDQPAQPRREQPVSAPTRVTGDRTREPEAVSPSVALVARTEPPPVVEPPTTIVKASPPIPARPTLDENREPGSASPATVGTATPRAADARTTKSVRRNEPLADPAPVTATVADAAPGDTPTIAGARTPSDAGATAAAVPATLAGATGSSDAGGERTLLALLHQAIDDRKRYPTLARRQRREGSATVLFRLHPDGALDRLELAASSGFDMLDKAALRAVADVAPFAPATRYLTRDKQFSVEVEFRLF